MNGASCALKRLRAQIGLLASVLLAASSRVGAVVALWGLKTQKEQATVVAVLCYPVAVHLSSPALAAQHFLAAEQQNRLQLSNILPARRLNDGQKQAQAGLQAGKET